MEIIQLTDETFEKAIQKACDTLARGGIVLYPTDTLYGLAVDARNRLALSQLQQLKGRAERKPISVVVEDVDAIYRYAHVSELARGFADRHLPGPLTLVLPSNGELPRELGLDGAIRIRIPDDDFARALARALMVPYTATSANSSGLPTLSTPLEILSQFGHRMEQIDLVIDAGPRASTAASTILRLVEDTPYIVREGTLTREELGL